MCQKQQPRCCHCANPLPLPTWIYCDGFRATAKFMTSSHPGSSRSGRAVPDPSNCRNTSLSVEEVPVLYGCDAIDECVAWIAAVSPGLKDYETRALRAERKRVAGEFAERRREAFVGRYCSKVDVQEKGGKGEKGKGEVKGFMKVAREAHWRYEFAGEREREERRAGARVPDGRDSFIMRPGRGRGGAARLIRFNGPPLEELVRQTCTPPPPQQQQQQQARPTNQSPSEQPPSTPILICPSDSSTAASSSSRTNPSPSSSSTATASTHLTIPSPDHARPRRMRTLSQPQLAAPRLTRGNPLLTVYGHGAPPVYDWITRADICGPGEDAAAAAESLVRVLEGPKRRRWSWSVGCCWKAEKEEVEDVVEGDEWVDAYWVL